MWNISADPMPSSTSTPVRSFQLAYRLGGRASPADRLSRRLERSVRSSRSELKRPAIMVGTLVRNVAR